MSDEATKYNGWTNYETWCVHLWLENEEYTYRYWRREGKRHLREAVTCANVQRGHMSVRESAISGLARQLNKEIHYAAPIDEASLFSDLLTTALSEVDWFEVAKAFIDEDEPNNKWDRDDDDEEDKEEDDEEDKDEEEEEKEIEQLKQERRERPKGPLFELGQVVITPGIITGLTTEEVEKAIRQHHQGDWGEVNSFDWRENEKALVKGCRLLSTYLSDTGIKFWVITEADRSSTCVLLPNEY